MYKAIILFLSLIFLSSCGEDCKFNSITNETLPDGKVGTLYEAQITYDLTCSYVSKYIELAEGSGQLPPGIELKTNGIFTGTPTTAGTYNFKVKVRMCFGSNGFEYTDCHDLEKDLRIVVSQ